MGREFYLKILKPVPDAFCQDRVFEDIELSEVGLRPAGYKGQPDKYHVKIKSRSVYASTGSIRDYLEKQMPGKNFNIWGMGYTHNGIHCYGDSWTYDIPDDIINAMKRPHINDIMMDLCMDSWSITDYGNNWLAEKCPIYATEDNLNKMLAWYMGYLKGKDKEDLKDLLENPNIYSGNLLQNICRAAAYAYQINGICFIEWE